LSFSSVSLLCKARWDELTVEAVQRLLAAGAEGLVIILPDPLHKIDDNKRSAWNVLDLWLVNESIRIPVFYVVDSVDVRAVEHKVRKTRIMRMWFIVVDICCAVETE
jgi:hypothetical protein